MAYPPYGALPQAAAFRSCAVPGTGLDAVKGSWRIPDSYDSLDRGLHGGAWRLSSPVRTVQVLQAPARCWSPERAISCSQDGLQLPPSWRGPTSSHASVVTSSLSTPTVPGVPASAAPSSPLPAASAIASLEQELAQSRRELHALQLQREAERQAFEARQVELLAELEELRPLRALQAKLPQEAAAPQRAPTSPTDSVGSMTRAEVDELVRTRVEASLQELVRGLLPGGLPGHREPPTHPGAEVRPQASGLVAFTPPLGEASEVSTKSLSPLPARGWTGPGVADAADASTPHVAPWSLRKAREEEKQESYNAEVPQAERRVAQNSVKQDQVQMDEQLDAAAGELDSAADNLHEVASQDEDVKFVTDPEEIEVLVDNSMPQDADPEAASHDREECVDFQEEAQEQQKLSPEPVAEEKEVSREDEVPSQANSATAVVEDERDTSQDEVEEVPDSCQHTWLKGEAKCEASGAEATDSRKSPINEQGLREVPAEETLTPGSTCEEVAQCQPGASQETRAEVLQDLPGTTEVPMPVLGAALAHAAEASSTSAAAVGAEEDSEAANSRHDLGPRSQSGSSSGAPAIALDGPNDEASNATEQAADGGQEGLRDELAMLSFAEVSQDSSAFPPGPGREMEAEASFGALEQPADGSRGASPREPLEVLAWHGQGATTADDEDEASSEALWSSQLGPSHLPQDDASESSSSSAASSRSSKADANRAAEAFGPQDSDDDMVAAFMPAEILQDEASPARSEARSASSGSWKGSGPEVEKHGQRQIQDVAVEWPQDQLVPAFEDAATTKEERSSGAAWASPANESSPSRRVAASTAAQSLAGPGQASLEEEPAARPTSSSPSKGRGWPPETSPAGQEEAEEVAPAWGVMQTPASSSTGWPELQEQQESLAASTPNGVSPDFHEVESRRFEWPGHQAPDWPQDDMVLAFGQLETFEVTAAPSSAWPQDAFGWPAPGESQSTVNQADDWGFLSWPTEAQASSMPVQPQPDAGASARQESGPLQELPKVEQKAQSTSPPKRATLRHSATQASNESPSRWTARGNEAQGQSSSPSQRRPLGRSATQGDSASPSRRQNLTWGTTQARLGDDSSTNLKEDMAQFMPWGA